MSKLRAHFADFRENQTSGDYKHLVPNGAIWTKGMNRSRPTAHLLALILAAWYFLIGYGSAVLDPSVPVRMRFAWRLGAWIACGIAYAVHIVCLQFKFRKSPLATAVHAAVAVALGAFLLALAASVHALMVASHAAYWKFLVALLVWPLITALPAFVVAILPAWVLSRFPRNAKPTVN